MRDDTSWIEILNRDARLGFIRHALFDFDGTLSLIREGWQAIMVPMFVDEIIAIKTGEQRSDIEEIVREFVTRLTGKQTIYQMFELCEQIKSRGGTPLDPLDYKHEYLRRLEVRIADRIAGLEAGTRNNETLLVPGSLALLKGLKDRGVRLYLASGTDEPFVIREAKLLGIAEYFDGGIYGALDDYKQFSKKMIVDRILKENKLSGPELIGIGDGYVEIENTKQVGGIALGVPTKEDQPTIVDTWKRDRLAAAGADFLVPNFLEHAKLFEFLFPTR